MPRPATFPTPPSSHAHESDLSSRTSQSPSNSSVHRLPQALSAGISNSLATSRGTLDVDPQFNALLVETRRYLSGPDFAYTLGCALDRATEVLMDGLRARVFVDTASAVNLPNTEEAQDVDTGARAENRDEVKIRLAGMLPGLARWSQLALNATPNELVDVSRVSIPSCPCADCILKTMLEYHGCEGGECVGSHHHIGLRGPFSCHFVTCKCLESITSFFARKREIKSAC